MELQKVSIENFKGIAYKELEFKSGLNIIKGENGTGKTSIMEALATLLSNIFANSEKKDIIPSGRNLDKRDYRLIYQKLGDGGYNAIHKFPLVIQANYNEQEQTYFLKYSYDEFGVISGRRKKIDWDSDANHALPVLIYEGIPRCSLSNLREEKNEHRTSLFYRKEGYRDSMQSGIDTKYITNWCARMEQISW